MYTLLWHLLMTDLSPAARAVLDAFVGDPTERDELEDDRRYLAAALRAAAEQVVPDAADHLRTAINSPDWWDAHDHIRTALLAIAAELEGQ